MIIRNESRNAQTGVVSAEVIDTVASTITFFTGANQTGSRALNAAEIAIYITYPAAVQNKATLEDQLAAFIDGADVAIANMQAIQNDPAPSFANLAQALTQVTALQNRVKLIASTEETHIRKTVALARHVSGQFESLENT